MNESLLRALIPAVIGVLVRRGADFASAEDAVQDALVRALDTWPADPPRDPKGWLVTVAWRRFLDQARAATARREREVTVGIQAGREPADAPVPATDDTLQLYFLCAHPSLSPTSAVALTLRAVGGLTTRQIATAYLVPEATMAQRISRAKRRVAGVPLDRPGELGTVLRALYLVFNEGYGGDVDLAAEAIRLTRQLQSMADAPEIAGLLARYRATTDERQVIIALTDAGRALRDAYFAKCYHQACDAWTPQWDARGLAADTLLVYDMGLELANSRQWPTWQKGAEFEAARETSDAARR